MFTTIRHRLARLLVPEVGKLLDALQSQQNLIQVMHKAYVALDAKHNIDNADLIGWVAAAVAREGGQLHLSTDTMEAVRGLGFDADRREDGSVTLTLSSQTHQQEETN